MYGFFIGHWKSQHTVLHVDKIDSTPGSESFRHIPDLQLILSPGYNPFNDDTGHRLLSLIYTYNLWLISKYPWKEVTF